MPARFATLTLAAVAILAADGRPAAAQDAVPMELVRVLVLSGRTLPDIAVGRVPAGFPAGVVPAGARVVGGARGDYGTMAVAAVAQPVREAEAALRQALMSSGWTDQSPMRQQTGFISNTSELPSILCQGKTALNFTAVPRDAGGSYLRLLFYAPETEYSPCQHSWMVQSGAAADTRIPALVGPPGVPVMASGSSFSSDGAASTRGRMRAAMAPAQILAHYAAQLQQAGWTPSPPVAGSDVGTQTFRMRDPAGKEVFGVLAVVAYPGSDARDLEFRTQPLPLPDMP
jgi:hypothetical protein